MSRMLPLLVFLLVGCAGMAGPKRARVGMTRAQVVATVGRPDETNEIFQTAVETLIYTTVSRSGSAHPVPRDKTYYVVLNSGRVTWEGTDMEKKIELTPSTALGFVKARKTGR